MGIYRGPGGTGDAVNDASSEALITIQARDAALAAQAAAEAAQTAAELAETNAETAETNAETAETNAETAATNAASSASAASTSASNAATSATNAANSATAAQTAETNAETAETNAAASASAASTSASNAATSATNASNSASAAATSATNASNSASAAATSATNAANSATAAQTAQTAAELAETNAETAEANAETAEANAAASASAAATSESNAATSASNAASSASSASTSASNAATSATNAANSASAASTSATNAANSASAALTSENNAASSASAAATSASNAATSATSASNSASAAATSETNAANSASAAATSASNASTSASSAATSATNASNSASAAATSATNASNSASAAATSASNAATSESNAASSASAAAASYDSFDDRYLGAKSSAPTLDNDGNTLLVGALYYDTVSSSMKVWSGSAWLDAYASLSGALIASNNLSDLTNTATARTNLGVAIGTDVQAYDADTAKLDVAQSWSAAQSFNAGVTLGDASGDALTINSSAVSIPNGLNFDSNTFVIDATNNRVGINTASPATALNIVGGELRGTGTGFFYSGYQAGGTTRQFYLGGADNAFYINVDQAVPMILATNNTERMRITSTGNVGIGTSSPAHVLSVFSSSASLASFTRDLATDVSLNISADNDGTILATGGVHAFRVFTNNAERLRLDSSGNLGLGVTPSAWYTTNTRALQMPSGSLQSFSNNIFVIKQNAFANSSGADTYVNTGFASQYQQYLGVHSWHTAPSGTAGNAITFTQAMTLDASGQLGIGTSSPLGLVDIVSSSGAVQRVRSSGTAGANTLYQNSNTGTTTGDGLYVGIDGTAGYLWNFENQPVILATNNTERMRIDSSGNVGIGTSSPTSTAGFTPRLQLTSAASTALIVTSTGTTQQNAFATNGSGLFIESVGSATGTDNNIIFRTTSTNSNYGGIERFRIGSAGQLGIGGANYGTAGQVLTSQGSGAAPVWQFPPMYLAEYLVVAGGGGGGFDRGGGGGAGGYLSGSITALQGTSYSVTVGGGGTGGTNYGNRTSGSNSVLGSLATAIGGGFGQNGSGGAGANGGSGGGGGSNGGGAGTGTSGQGNNGGAGTGGSGGGGGAGAVGQNGGSGNGVGGNGGNGLTWLNGTTYAGGGGGGAAMDFPAPRSGGTGGTGGGGAGGNTNSQAGTAGTANTGGGGGGGANVSAAAGGNGGSGVVIIRYAGGQRATGGTVTSAGGYTYHTFTTSGTFTA